MAPRRWRHFRMELQAINALLGIMPLHRGNGRIVRVRDGAETWRHPLDAISVRHPNNRRTTGQCPLNRSDRSSRLSSARPNSVRRLFHVAALRGGSPTASHSRCQNGDALLEQLFGDLWRLFVVDARGSAGQHDTFGTIGQDRGERNRAGQDLRIDLRFADASCDQLRIGSRNREPEFDRAKSSMSARCKRR